LKEMNNVGVQKIIIDNHREIAIVNVNQDTVIAIIDAVVKATKRDEYVELTSFSIVEIARKKIVAVHICENAYGYTLYEEALCLKNQDTCTVMSYIAYIMCNEGSCEEEKLINTVKCIASRY